MILTQINSEILSSFVGTLLAILSAGIIWFFKASYEKHKNEISAIKRLERNTVENIALLSDNFEFIDTWIASLEQDRPFSISFNNLISNREDSYNVSNLELINAILKLDYKIERTNNDINNIYSRYWVDIFKFDITTEKGEKDFHIYNQNTKNTLVELKTNEDVLRNELINLLAVVYSVVRVKKHSLFGYLNFLFIDIFPRVNQKIIEKNVEKLKAKMEKIKSNNDEQK